MNSLLPELQPVIQETRALCPGQNQPEHDLVQTPTALAQRVIDHYQPTGSVLDPARGQGAFFDALKKRPEVSALDWCEITEGRDFLAHRGRYDWIITNPPWSQMADFLTHAMRLADNVVFLVTLTHLDTRARDRTIVRAGFGRKEALLLPHPPQPWPSSGFLLCAYHLQRGWTGGLHFERKFMDYGRGDLLTQEA